MSGSDTETAMDSITYRAAACEADWDAAFRLLKRMYVARGYEPAGPSPWRMTVYQALPKTAVYLAEAGGVLLGTLTLVGDPGGLALPMEGTFRAEVADLRVAGRALAEFTSLAVDAPGRPVVGLVSGLARLAVQVHLRRGGDTFLAAVHPRHERFHRRCFGLERLGPERSFEPAGGAPAVPMYASRAMMESASPALFEPLPEAALDCVRMPVELARRFYTP